MDPGAADREILKMGALFDELRISDSEMRSQGTESGGDGCRGGGGGGCWNIGGCGEGV